MEIFKNQLDSLSCPSIKMKVELLPSIRMWTLINIFRENIQIYFNKSKENLPMDNKSANKFVNDIKNAIKDIPCSVCKFEYNLFWSSNTFAYYHVKTLFEIVKLVHIDFTKVSNILEKKSQTDQKVVNNAYQLIANHIQNLEKLELQKHHGSSTFYWNIYKDRSPFLQRVLSCQFEFAVCVE